MNNKQNDPMEIVWTKLSTGKTKKLMVKTPTGIKPVTLERTGVNKYRSNSSHFFTISEDEKSLIPASR